MTAKHHEQHKYVEHKPYVYSLEELAYTAEHTTHSDLYPSSALVYMRDALGRIVANTVIYTRDALGRIVITAEHHN